MGLKKEHTLLLVLFLLVFGSRLYFALQTPYFSDQESYDILRQVESITKTGKPLLNDPLSYGGRKVLFSPIMHYFYAAFYKMNESVTTLKFVSNLMASTIIFGAFLISYYFTKNTYSSFIPAILCGFSPLYYETTVNSLSIFSLLLPLMLFSIYLLLKHKKKPTKYSLWTVLSLFILIILSPYSIIIILGFLLFLLLLYIEELEITTAELELAFVTLFLYLWFNFLLYKKALAFHGISVIWQNTPHKLFDNFFVSFDLFKTIYSIGILSFIFGVYIIFVYVTSKKLREVYLLMGVALSLFLLLWFKLIAFNTGLIFLGIILSLLVSQYVKGITDYTQKTIISKHTTLVYTALLLFILATSMIPSFLSAQKKIDQTANKEYVDAFIWINNNTKSDATIFGSLPEGAYITYFAQRKNVIDTNYLFITDVNERISDVDKVYTSAFYSDVLEILKKYDAKYLIVSKETLDSYGLQRLRYESSTCFYPVYNQSILVYEVFC